MLVKQKDGQGENLHRNLFEVKKKRETDSPSSRMTTRNVQSMFHWNGFNPISIDMLDWPCKSTDLNPYRNT